MVTFANILAKKSADYKDILELWLDSDEYIYFRTKKVFTFEENGMFFKYRYVVYCLMLDNDDDNIANHEMFINMAVEPEYVNFEVLYSTAYAYGLEGTDFEPDCVDIMRESSCPIIFLEEGIVLENKPWLEQEVFINKLNAASSIIETIDAMRSDFFEEVWNRIGATGWDSLRYFLYGTCPIKASLSKIGIAQLAIIMYNERRFT